MQPRHPRGETAGVGMSLGVQREIENAEHPAVAIMVVLLVRLILEVLVVWVGVPCHCAKVAISRVTKRTIHNYCAKVGRSRVVKHRMIHS
jgi:hypothetical protein